MKPDTKAGRIALLMLEVVKSFADSNVNVLKYEDIVRSMLFLHSKTLEKILIYYPLMLQNSAVIQTWYFTFRSHL